MSTRTWAYVLVVLFPSIGVGSPAKNVSDQETTYVRASPLKVPATIEQGVSDVVEGDASGGDGLGYGNGVGVGSGGYGEGTSDYYGDSNYGYTKNQAVNGTDEIISESAPYEVPVQNVSSPVNTTGAAISTEPEDERSWKAYVSLMGGLVDPYRLANVNGKGAAGIGGGVLFENNIAVEASFLYAYLQSGHGYCSTDNAACRSGSRVDLLSDNFIDHYSFSLEGKYFFDLGSMLFPHAGLVGAYTFRQHNPDASPAVRESTAFDAGLSLGMDYRVSKRVQLGLAWRYMSNLAYDINGGNRSEALGLREVSPEAGGSLSDYETSDYQVWMANVKVLF